MTLDVADYTDVMSTLNNILTETPINQRQAATTPALTPQQFKNGLLTPWTAAMIGRLVVKYESEWYADESLSKWNELDDLHQNEYEEHKQIINDELDRCNITQQAYRDRPLNLLEKNHQCFIDKWQIEKQDRIKPSLWWHEVLNGQKENSEAGKLSNDGQAWHFHPVGMMIFLKKIEDGIIFDVKINNFIYEYIIYYESYKDLILKYEGYVPTPYVPKNSKKSGVTLGYGYDLGQQSKTTVKKELSDIYTSEQIERLLVVLGKKGDQAKAYLSSISDIKISKEDAKRLSIRSKARYAQKVVDIYPESISLSNDQRGAFLSLI